MVIGVDIDGVLFPWADLANEAVMAHFGIPDPGPHTTWLHLKNTIEPHQWRWLWSTDGQDVVFGHWNCRYPDAVAAVNRILKMPGHRVHFVTHRDPRRTGINTARFLDFNFEHPWAGLHIVQNSVRKRSLAKWDVFVDDKPDTVWDFVANTNAQVFAPRRPWNEEELDVEGSGLVLYDDASIIADWVEERT